MKLVISSKALGFLCGLFFCGELHAQAPLPLPVSHPEKEGVSSAAILSFVERLERDLDADCKRAGSFR